MQNNKEKKLWKEKDATVIYCSAQQCKIIEKIFIKERDLTIIHCLGQQCKINGCGNIVK